MTGLYKDPLIYPILDISDSKPIEWLASFKTNNKPKYNSKFKNQVRDLTTTCVHNYITVYRMCSIFGVKKAKEIIYSCYEVQIQYLLDQYWYFPSPMSIDEEETCRATLRDIDPALQELFEHLLESSEYNSETLYRVFMSHGSGAKEIVEYAIENELMPFQLLQYSDKKLNDSGEAAFKRIKEFNKNMSK